MASTDLVNAMAEAAHKAWMEAVATQGYTSRRSPWGEECMVPFDQLSERAQEFDRVIVRAILRVLKTQPDPGEETI